MVSEQLSQRFLQILLTLLIFSGFFCINNTIQQHGVYLTKKVPLNASLIASSNRWLKQCISVSQGESSSQILAPRPLCIPVFTLAPSIFKPWSQFPEFKIPICLKDYLRDDKSPFSSTLLTLSMLKNLT